jgi:hypothetical protein
MFEQGRPAAFEGDSMMPQTTEQEQPDAAAVNEVNERVFDLLTDVEPKIAYCVLLTALATLIGCHARDDDDLAKRVIELTTLVTCGAQRCFARRRSTDLPILE